MEPIITCCAGLDVHKETIQACVRRIEPDRTLHTQTRQWSTMTGDLNRMADWLAGQGVTDVAMESTGVFWKPIYNILEGRFKVMLVNPRDLRHVAGRKTDVKDCQWIAQLLQFGLLRPSFVPARSQRVLRDLTRQRTQLVAEKTRIANRIHKTLEDANIKLSSVATDILGASGRDMIRALLAGERDPNTLAELARQRLREKIPELRQALEGHFTDHHRFLLQLQWDHLRHLEQLIEQLDQKIEELTRPFQPIIRRMDEVAGIDRRVAEVVLAEVGSEVSVFPTARQLTSWTGICPGNNESAGKRKSGKTTKGNRWLRQALVQAAWAASHEKNSYLAAQYRRLVGRRGKKRALIAVAHSLLVIIYHLLKDPTCRYQDLGSDYFDRLDPERTIRQLVKRLERLGHRVILEPLNNAA